MTSSQRSGVSRGSKNPAISKCYVIIIDSIVLGCLLCPHVKGSRKPTCSCLGLFMSAKSGSTSFCVNYDVSVLLVSYTFFILARKYFLTWFKQARSAWRCTLTPPTILESYAGSARTFDYWFCSSFVNFLIVLSMWWVTWVSWSSDFILSTLRPSWKGEYGFFESRKCF